MEDLTPGQRALKTWELICAILEDTGLPSRLSEANAKAEERLQTWAREQLDDPALAEAEEEDKKLLEFFASASDSTIAVKADAAKLELAHGVIDGQTGTPIVVVWLRSMDLRDESYLGVECAVSVMASSWSFRINAECDSAPMMRRIVRAIGLPDEVREDVPESEALEYVRQITSYFNAVFKHQHELDS